MATNAGPKNLTNRVNEATPSAIADVDRLFRDRLRSLVRHEMGRRLRATARLRGRCPGGASSPSTAPWPIVARSWTIPVACGRC